MSVMRLILSSVWNILKIDWNALSPLLILPLVVCEVIGLDCFILNIVSVTGSRPSDFFFNKGRCLCQLPWEESPCLPNGSRARIFRRRRKVHHEWLRSRQSKYRTRISRGQFVPETNGRQELSSRFMTRMMRIAAIYHFNQNNTKTNEEEWPK